MHSFRICLLVLFYLASTALVAGADFEILPTYHWSYDYIEELQRRGLCLDLLIMNKPYTRGEIARSLSNIKKKMNKENDNHFTEQLLQRLFTEFSEEMEDNAHDRFNFKNNIRTNFDRDRLEHIDYRGIYRSGIGINLKENLFAFTGVNFNQYDYYDSSYFGYKWRGIAGYTEQAYLHTKWNRIDLKFGRDFLQWGVGESGTLILSNICRPLDHLLAAVSAGPFRFSFLAAQLDEFNAVEVDSLRVPFKRYLTGHRLDVSLWGGRIQAAISEVLLYGGLGESFNMAYLNPIMFYKGAHKNGDSYYGNILPTVDFLIYPLKNLNFYSSILIDDIQLEKTVRDDLEPNEIAWLVGLNWADPLDIAGLSFNAEYVRIANRTYITPLSYETFIHRGRPIGHPLGNDVDQWLCGFAYWIRSLRFQLNVSHTRDGEGDLFTPFEELWLDYTLDEGYHESFPSGVVEKTTNINLNANWYYNNWLRFYVCVNHSSIDNINHVAGKNERCWHGKIMAEFTWNWSRELSNE